MKSDDMKITLIGSVIYGIKLGAEYENFTNNVRDRLKETDAEDESDPVAKEISVHILKFHSKLKVLVHEMEKHIDEVRGEKLNPNAKVSDDEVGQMFRDMGFKAPKTDLKL